MKKRLKTSKLELNKGQVEGLPCNPRYISDEKFERLKNSLVNSGEFLDARPLIVYPYENKYVVIAGNMRLKAAQELGFIDIPCYVLPKNTPKEKLREYTIKDNIAYGATDWDVLKDWEEEELREWDMDLPDCWLDDELEDFEADEMVIKEEKKEFVEVLLNEATKGIASDIVNQFDVCGGFSFVSHNTAKFDFINFCYYGKEYPRYNSLAFHKQQFTTIGDNYSTYEGLKRVVSGDINPERLRFVCQDKFRQLICGSLAFGGAKMPLDFPASLAKDLIDELCPERGSVLDPCSGWGGRLVGFLASKAIEYHGTDASPLQVDGDALIYNTFKDVVAEEKIVDIECMPFEKKTLENESFDFALTSPPYFDTEKYIGGEQSHSTSHNYEEWRNTFYSTLIKKVYEALKPGAFFALQIGSQRYPLLDDGRIIAKNIGFSIYEIRPTDMKNNQQKTDEERGEVVLILKK